MTAMLIVDAVAQTAGIMEPGTKYNEI